MRKTQKIINLFGEKEISSIKRVFSISDEEDLDQCWDYFHTKHSQSQSLNHFMQRFYEFTHHYIMENDSYFFDLILEDSQEYYFLTVWNKKISKQLALFLEKEKLDFLFDKKRLTIRLERIVDKVMDEHTPPIKKILPKVSTAEAQKTLEKNPYDFIATEEVEELLVLCEDMEDIIHIAKKNHFCEALFIRLRSCVSLFAFTLEKYQEIKSVSSIMRHFSALINTKKDRFLELSSDEILLIEGFNFNIQRWLNTLFIDGYSELNFMDDSLQADYEMIVQLLVSPKEPSDIVERDLSEIFDF